jgi:CubicO group peptidase (beta-lactamase class C family)
LRSSESLRQPVGGVGSTPFGPKLKRLLLPLGFTNFGFSKAALESPAAHAYPHERARPSVQRGKLWPMQATPAGGINASAADMGRWLRFLLSSVRAVAPPPTPPLEKSLENISGEYRQPAYGCISIASRAAGMHWKWRGLRGILTYFGPNSYQLKEDGAIPRYPGGLFVSLEMNEKDQFVALKSPLEPAVSDIVFQRDVGLVLQ